LSRSASNNSLRETIVPLVLLAGDTVVTFAGLALGYWIRYASPLAPSTGEGIFIPVPDATFDRYLPLLLVGVALLVGAFAQFGLYDTRLLLRRYQSLNAILKGAAFWLVAYLGVSLVLKFDPPISRLFVVIAFLCVVALVWAWRAFVYAVITHGPLLPRLRRRVVLLGWNREAQSLAAEITADPTHPFILAGIISLPTDTTPPFSPPLPTSPSPSPALPLSPSQAPHLTFPLPHLSALPALLPQTSADVLIITRLDLPRADLQHVVETCERAYVEWKIVPGAFDIFLSGLRLQTIGHVPVLGVDELPINRLFNRALKRTVDLLGATVGLLASAPFVLVLAALIKRESPRGPVFFRQTRIGNDHRSFTLYKLRSMAPDAAATDSAQQSTARDDPRLLRIGAFMRRWNLDELPQYWNVLRGDMSLVGPRPERPHHVDQLAHAIPHYLPRHVVKPGMTGWAQVNGLRGDSDLTARAQHDIYYIENWSLWLDVQILLLTFARWRHTNAY
jgi:exopolysaccharide biosynthesis polyprenyl glycosylphosphotransferase